MEEHEEMGETEEPLNEEQEIGGETDGEEAAGAAEKTWLLLIRDNFLFCWFYVLLLCFSCLDAPKLKRSCRH